MWIELQGAGNGSLLVDTYSNYSTTTDGQKSLTLAATDRVVTDITANTWAMQYKLSHSTAAQCWQGTKLAFGVSPMPEDRVQ